MSVRAIKKILMIGWELPPFNSGGLGVACQNLARALLKKRIKIFFALPSSQKSEIFSEGIVFFHPFSSKTYSNKIPPQFYTYAFAKTFQYNTKNSYFHTSSLLKKKIIGSSDNLMQQVMSYSNIVDAVKNLDFDIIHAHDWLTIPAALAIKEISDKPLVVHVHALEFDRSGGNSFGNSEIGSIEREGLIKADKIIAVSNYTKRKISSCYNIDPDKIEVVYNGISREVDDKILGYKADFLKNKKIIIFVGRLTVQKGIDWFLRAAQRVIKEEPQALFIVVGEGELKFQAIELATELGIGKSVIFTGFLSREELSKIYRIASLYVLPSVSEPFGIAPLEALKYDTPIILSKTAGVGEVLNGALKVDFWDTEQMAEKMVAVLRYPTLYKQLIQDGKRDLIGITWDIAAEKVEKIYDNLIRN
ncbi:glycosyltransferase family 1 protein [bacterium]|nr:MAG: glycosyltransferase family 1 protein [bacterium]